MNGSGFAEEMERFCLHKPHCKQMHVTLGQKKRNKDFPTILGVVGKGRCGQTRTRTWTRAQTILKYPFALI